VTRRDVEPRPIYLPPWRVDVTVRDGVPSVAPVAALARGVARALDAAGAPSPASIGLILADDAELAGLNATHMGADGPTDVLSFPLLDPEAFPLHPGSARRGPVVPDTFVAPPGRRHLGDIVVSVERAIEQAAAGRGGHTGDVAWSAADELRLLVTHGTLHVCGWDHAEPAEEAAMRSLERRLLGA
jgi:probable rRNA maturation factor